jgi:uncharacterized membrane protein YraQ (UPF0718 family)
MNWFAFSWQNFWFAFLALVFEGVPFILFGSLISGVIAAFIPARLITGMLPKSRFAAILVSGLLGVIFPVCDCGIVPIVRRMLKKGVPLSCGVAYMLASPIVNPLVIFRTFVAFQGQQPLLNTGLRVAIGYFIAVMIGLIAGTFQSGSILRKGLVTPCTSHRTAIKIAPLPDATSDPLAVRFAQKILDAIRTASDDFLGTTLYFMVGAAIAATFNTAVNQQLILPLASHSVPSIMAMMGLSGILTLCSTSDAFIAATFATFPAVSRMAFLIFGPMFDLKLIFLYSALFKKRFVLALGVGLFLSIGVTCGIIVSDIYASQGF